MRQGVPQGGVLSPVLFNLYMSKVPTPPGNIKLVTYADDSEVLNSGTKIPPLCDELNMYLDTLNTWFTERNLLISPSKSSATLFTTFSNELAIQLPITKTELRYPQSETQRCWGSSLTACSPSNTTQPPSRRNFKRETIYLKHYAAVPGARTRRPYSPPTRQSINLSSTTAAPYGPLTSVTPAGVNSKHAKTQP